MSDEENAGLNPKRWPDERTRAFAEVLDVQTDKLFSECYGRKEEQHPEYVDLLLWGILDYGYTARFGSKFLSFDDVKMLQWLASEAGGWWVAVEGEWERVFIPTAEMKSLYRRFIAQGASNPIVRDIVREVADRVGRSKWAGVGAGPSEFDGVVDLEVLSAVLKGVYR